MFRLRIALICATLMSCSSLAIRKELVGEYKSENDQIISIDPHGFAIHSITMKGKRKRKVLGFFIENQKGESSYVIFGPDTSMFLGTEMKPNSDHSSIFIDWKSVRNESVHLDVVYNRI